MDRNARQEEFRDALDVLETMLETPIVHGKLPAWIANVRSAFTCVDQLLRSQIDEAHQLDFETMAASDPGLAHRVDSLKEKDQRLLHQLNELQSALASTSGQIAAPAPDEGAIRDECTDLVNLGLSFVIHVRTQEVAMRTWLREAANHDVDEEE